MSVGQQLTIMEHLLHVITISLLFHHLHHLAAGAAINHTKQIYSIGEMSDIQLGKAVVNTILHDQFAIDVVNLQLRIHANLFKLD